MSGNSRNQRRAGARKPRLGLCQLCAGGCTGIDTRTGCRDMFGKARHIGLIQSNLAAGTDNVKIGFNCCENNPLFSTEIAGLCNVALQLAKQQILVALSSIIEVARQGDVALPLCELKNPSRVAVAALVMDWVPDKVPVARHSLVDCAPSIFSRAAAQCSTCGQRQAVGKRRPQCIFQCRCKSGVWGNQQPDRQNGGNGGQVDFRLHNQLLSHVVDHRHPHR